MLDFFSSKILSHDPIPFSPTYGFLFLSRFSLLFGPFLLSTSYSEFPNKDNLALHAIKHATKTDNHCESMGMG